MRGREEGRGEEGEGGGEGARGRGGGRRGGGKREREEGRGQEGEGEGGGEGGEEEGGITICSSLTCATLATNYNKSSMVHIILYLMYLIAIRIDKWDNNYLHVIQNVPDLHRTQNQTS